MFSNPFTHDPNRHWQGHRLSHRPRRLSFLTLLPTRCQLVVTMGDFVLVHDRWRHHWCIRRLYLASHFEVAIAMVASLHVDWRVDEFRADFFRLRRLERS